jgi:predicted nucleotidyltransferase
MLLENIENIVEDIVNEVDPEKIILFGSFAKGNQDQDSDLDLLIIEKAPFTKNRSRRREIQRIREKLSKYRIPKDILVYDKLEFEYWKDSVNHIIANSLRDGKILYER